MGFEPQKFFIGLTDFFAVWMPGAVLTYLLLPYVQPAFVQYGYAEPAGVQGWAIFLITSYTLGHFVFLLGSVIFDRVYDELGEMAVAIQKSGRKGTHEASKSFRHRLSDELFGDTWYLSKEQAKRIKNRHLGPAGERPSAFAALAEQIKDRLAEATGEILGVAQEPPPARAEDRADAAGSADAAGAIGLFSWCKARLALEHPESLAMVDRYEADSKFFRSLLVLLLMLIPLKAAASPPGLLWAIGTLILLSFWRFIEQRAKATGQLYGLIITLAGEERRGGGSAIPRPKPKA